MKTLSSTNKIIDSIKLEIKTSLIKRLIIKSNAY